MIKDNVLPSIFQPPIQPVVGFILQKDVYTTNLLYANDQFSTKSLRKTLPFRRGSGRKPNNPSSSLTILRQNGFASENSEDEEIFYMRNTFKPKKLHNRHLKFPLPKIKSIPLTNSILREDICKQDIKIKYMEDDLNITSKFGKKIIYNLKENTNPYETQFPKKKSKFKFPIKNKKYGSKKKYNTIYGQKMKKYNSEFKLRKSPMKKFNKLRIKDYKNATNILPVRQAIYQINSELKLFELEDKERKRAFFKNEFFATQLNTNSNNNNNDTSSNKNKSIYEPI
jgi:hypothetical protein